MLHGGGVADLPALLARSSRQSRGFDALELFSAEGSTGTGCPDSLWTLGGARARHRGRAALAAAWESRSRTLHERILSPHEEREES
jgi:hypothetical protein